MVMDGAWDRSPDEGGDLQDCLHFLHYFFLVAPILFFSIILRLDILISFSKQTLSYLYDSSIITHFFIQESTMRILFVGVLDVPWSTHIPMANELTKLNNNVVKFNFRTITNKYRLVPEFTIRNKYHLIGKILNKINKWYGRKKMNEALFNNVITNKYDLVFLGKAEEVDPKTIHKIKRYSKVWYFFMDPLSTAPRS